MLIILLASLSGVIAVATGERLPNESISLILAAAGALIGITGWFVSRMVGAISHREFLLQCSLFISFFWISVGWAAYCGNMQRVQLPDGDWVLELVETKRTQYGRSLVKARLICIFRLAENGAERCESISVHPLNLPAYVNITYPRQLPFGVDFKWLPGERWRAVLAFKIPEFKGNPGFDRYRWALSERLVGSASINETVRYVEHRKTIHYWRYWLSKRLLYDSSIESSSYSNLSLYPIVQALTLGDRRLMDDAHWQLFRDTGTTHLMAISGLHMGLLSGWVYWFVRLLVGGLRVLNQRYYPQSVAAIAAICVAALYGAIAGFSLPTQRAFIMLLFACIGSFTNRPKIILNSLVVALLVILILQPFAVLTASLWLSFGAVLLVFYILANRLEQLNRSSNFVQKLGLILKLQACIFICMAPLSFYFFGGASINGLLSNIIAIPLVTGILLPACFGNAVVAAINPSWVPFLGELNVWLLDALLCCLQWVNTCFPDFQFRSIDVFELILLLMAGLLICSPLSRAYKAVGNIVFVAILLQPTTGKGSSVTLFNSKAMLAVFNTDQGHQLFLDEAAGFSNAEKSILSSLYPEVKRRQDNLPYWYSAWFQPQWFFSSMGSIDQAPQNACEYPEGAMVALGVRTVKIHSFSLQDTKCAISFHWKELHWLLLGKLSAEDQHQILVDGLISLDEPVDFLLLTGDYFSGVFLSQFEGASVILWNSEELDSNMSDRFRARNMPLIELAVQGAHSLRFTNSTYSWEPVIKKRFYHP